MTNNEAAGFMRFSRYFVLGFTPAQTRAKGRDLWNPFFARACLDAARPFRSAERKMLGCPLKMDTKTDTILDTKRVKAG